MPHFIDWSGCPIIERDSEKLHGAPTVRGVRITPDAIMENFEGGVTVPELLELFGGITQQDVRIVLEYARKRIPLAHSV
jgi:uncharacterized protein (DUF433 family)